MTTKKEANGKMQEIFVARDAPLPKGGSIFFYCLLVYLAILSVSNTVALRNVLLLILMAGVLFSVTMSWNRQKTTDIRSLLKHVPIIFLLWAAFLVLFPLWAMDSGVAWQNLRGPWFETLVAWVVGFGAAWVLGPRAPSLWLLALASSFPVVLHLVLTLIAWGGLAGPELLVDPSIYTFWLTIKTWLSSGIPAPRLQSFPLGFRGVEPMHGNIGYAACQAIGLASACFFAALKSNERKLLFQSSLLIVLCFASIFIAYSRGAAIFGILMLAMAAGLYGIKFLPRTSMKGISFIRVTRPQLLLVATALGVIVLVGFQSIRKDARWHSMIDKIELGMTVREPENVLCEGLSERDKEEIRERFSERGMEYIDTLIQGLEGQDGARILLMREGWKLLKENPGGLDGSRQSYQKLMKEACGHVPKLDHAHAHQAWINLALSTGWLGAGLFALLMGYFVLAGWRGTGASDAGFFAFALFLIGVFWILRGFFDAVYQDHYLQMQAVIMAYLFMRMKFGVRSISQRTQFN